MPCALHTVSSQSGEPRTRQSHPLAHPLILLAIRDRIDFPSGGENLYVKAQGLDQALAALAPIAAAAVAETARLKAAVAATRKDGRQPSPEALAAIGAAFAREQEAGILLSLATGARILTLTVADWAALQGDGATTA